MHTARHGSGRSTEGSSSTAGSSWPSASAKAFAVGGAAQHLQSQFPDLQRPFSKRKDHVLAPAEKARRVARGDGSSWRRRGPSHGAFNLAVAPGRRWVYIGIRVFPPVLHNITSIRLHLALHNAIEDIDR
jgi:hypothetical protein